MLNNGAMGVAVSTHPKPEHRSQHVYDKIKRDLILGHYPFSFHLSHEHLAQEHGVSKTTIRMALVVLAHEGWVVPSHSGNVGRPASYVAWAPSVEETTFYHSANMDLLLAQIDRTVRLGGGTGPQPLDWHADIEHEGSDFRRVVETGRLFGAVGGSLDDKYRERAVLDLAERLFLARLVERKYLPNVDEELAEMKAALDAEDYKHLKRMISAYTKLRIKLAPDINREQVALVAQVIPFRGKGSDASI